MNWGVFALCASVLLTLVWALQLRKGRWTWLWLYTSFGCLLAACFNTAAPFRGYLDPEYVGFGFGLLQAERGLTVTAMAGAILIACGVSAMVAASLRAGPALWIVAVTCAAMFVILGVPTLINGVTDPHANAMQFGEYLTIPGQLGTLIMVFLLSIPFAVGAVWASRGALQRT